MHFFLIISNSIKFVARLSDWMGAMAGLGGMTGLAPLDPPLVTSMIIIVVIVIIVNVLFKKLKVMPFLMSHISQLVRCNTCPH